VSSTRTSVLLVEDHAVMGRMLARLLQEQGKMEMWAVIETGEAALEKLAAANERLPDLALVDVSLPGMSGIDLVAELARLYSTLPCLMLSAHRDLNYARQALDNGARGYVTKGDPPAIIDAIQRVLAGEIYLSDPMRRAVEA
jgi:two-component system, NarL family, invasion response regulator UvrY